MRPTTGNETNQSATTPTSLLPANNWPMDPFNGTNGNVEPTTSRSLHPTAAATIPFYPTPYSSQTPYSSSYSARS